MKNISKLSKVAVALFVTTTFAAEVPDTTFPIWGNVANGGTAIESYNLISRLPGHEFVGFTLKCFDGGTDTNPDVFVLRSTIYDALSGNLKYELVSSIDSQNNFTGSEECTFNSLGVGVAVSGEKRVVIIGMGEADHAVIYGYNAETGAKYYVRQFPKKDADDYYLAYGTALGEWSTVGNFISNRSDQLRVAYFKGGLNLNGPIDVKITYYNVLNGNQIGNPILMTVPAPELVTP